MNLLIIFLTGLTTGGLSCLAVQGGLLASVIANQKDQKPVAANKNEQKSSPQKSKLTVLEYVSQQDLLPVTMFLLAKLAAHIGLGFLLGWLGSAITLSLGLRLAFQTFTALFMFATAMNLLNVHPIFRYVVITPPKFIQRLVRGSSKSKAWFAPAVLGLLTIFIPCGVTQAMEVLAINSGNPIAGALIMAAFVLGTMPLFAALGVATAKLSSNWYQNFSKIAAAALIVMAIYSFNGVLVVINSPLTINKLFTPIQSIFTTSQETKSNGGNINQVNGIQKVTINVLNQGYSPSYIQVKAGVPVQLTLQSNNTYSCALAFVFREFGINTFLEATDSQIFSFTPTVPGKYTYTCSMGMYTGILEVIK